MPLLIAMGATAGSAAAASCVSGDDDTACESGQQAQAQGRVTTTFGVTYRLILLSGIGCPTALGDSPYACVEYTADPPTIYMRDGMDRYTRRYALRHEIGHVACWRTSADTSERCADRWAKAHMPKPKRKQKKKQKRKR